jgi:epoxyqueuosine reductase
VRFAEDTTRESLREHAFALGFVGCGFTSAEPLACGPLLRGWLARERHGQMDYLARNLERRVAPAAVFASATSVIVLAWPCAPAPPARRDWREALTGRIASYALGRDYHQLLGEIAERLAAAVRELCGGSTRVHVDAGPLVEKELAKRAGLGWYGHNTNLLTRNSGSYLLLACVLTEARFEPDPPFAASHCGSCRACVPGCPTGALDEGPTIDAPKCISYLTIEHRGPIAPQARATIGNWVFGCDVCQEVCPWNSPASPSPRPELEPDLPELLTLSEAEFQARFGATAVARAKRRGLARNAAVALGNSANPAAADALAEALASHDEPLVRAHAAWALASVNAAQVAGLLSRARRHEKVPPVLREIDAALDRVSRGGTRKS